VRIEWLPEAERTLTAQLDWIAGSDPWAAIDVGDTVHAAVRRLADYPGWRVPGG
jgi:plasmid stabilization system protein ParE